MSLQSIGASTIPNEKAQKQQSLRLNARGTNNISDIDGAKPAQKMNKFINKPNHTYDISDIHGSRPLALHRATNSIDYTLKHDDIEGSRPRGATHKQARSNNPVDPLMPNYKLPSYELPPDPTPKFLRDSLNVGDIDGTRSKPLYRFPTRENVSVIDIEGAQAGWKPRHKRVQKEGKARDLMEVADINMQGVKKTQRCTDPLRPVHFINGMVVQDDMTHTMPKKLPPKRDGPFFPLTTKDIDGAWPGWCPPHAMQPPLEQRRHFRNTNFVGDIAGAQSDTVQHCIRTNRVTNPLNPAYTSLDGDPMQIDQNKSKATLEAEASLRYAEENSRRQENEARERAAISARRSQAFNNTTEFQDIQVPESQYSQPPAEFVAPVSHRSNNQEGDRQDIAARDARIAQLEAEVNDLRTTFSQKLPTQPMAMSNGFSAPGGDQTFYRQPSPGGSRGPSPRNSRGPSPRNSRGPSPRNSRAPSPSGSYRSTGSKGADRMVLRSSDGQPRVSITPREVRQQRAYEADIAAVRDL
ncbi:hypothetical protein TrLO_g8767 [Triparma laevis f. longispina]|uniref:Uncharacterized protein n=1 Tax=Triparma laevis f. longispina TaxID=1714387 RepID=A0A9W7CAG7_9STRA|nr:hypothetical protein TrLO_g8767 [Triparma laevis f. longispina]